MEDLVLERIMLRFKSKKQAEKPRLETDRWSVRSRPSTIGLKPEEFEEAQKPPISPVSPVSEVSNKLLSSTESSDDLYGLTPVQSKRSVLEEEHQKQQDAAVDDAKRSLATIKKLALRFGVKVAVGEGRTSSQTRKLQKTQLNRNLEASSPYAAPVVEHLFVQSDGFPLPKEHTNGYPLTHVESDGFPLPVPLTPVPTREPQPNSPPSLPLGVSADHNLARLLPPIQGTNDLANSIDEKLSTIHAPAPTLKSELEATQQKLTLLFESQAMLRERYNAEKDKSSKLDSEYQYTHTRIHSLEQTTRDMNDELKRLQEYVSSLETANQALRGSQHSSENQEWRGGMRTADFGLELGSSRDDLDLLLSARPVSPIPPVPAIQPLRMKPPPIPPKADRRSLANGDSPPLSKTNSNNRELSEEDKSYWRVGDITTIAEARDGLPRPLWHHRRSISMSDDMLRRANDSFADQNGWPQPKRSSSIQVAAALTQKDPLLHRRTPLLSQMNPYSQFPNVQGFPGSSYAPFSAFETPTPAASNDQLTPVPSNTRYGSVPNTPSAKVPSTAASKVPNGFHRPPYEREETQPRVHGKAKATNGSGATQNPWPLYPEESPLDDLRRSATTAKGKAVANARTKQPPSLQSSVYSAELASGSEGTYGRRKSRAPSTIGIANTQSMSSSSGSRPRRLKLKQSLELMPNCARREAKQDASRQAAILGKPVSPTTSHLENRGFALYRFITPVPAGDDMLVYNLERLKPSLSTSKVMTTEPTTMKVTFPRSMRGIEGTVGMYDSVTDMWLNPHAIKKRK